MKRKVYECFRCDNKFEGFTEYRDHTCNCGTKTKKVIKEETMKVPVSVNLAVPNTSNVKMSAILEICKAIRSVAEALNSVHTNITIANNILSGGVSVKLDDNKKENEK